MEKFKSQGGAFVHEFCDHGTRADCRRNNPQGQPCRKVGDHSQGHYQYLKILFDLLVYVDLLCIRRLLICMVLCAKHGTVCQALPCTKLTQPGIIYKACIK